MLSTEERTFITARYLETKSPITVQLEFRRRVCLVNSGFHRILYAQVYPNERTKIAPSPVAAIDEQLQQANAEQCRACAHVVDALIIGDILVTLHLCMRTCVTVERVEGEIEYSKMIKFV